MFGPLGFVIGISMIKDLLEDLKRYKMDKDENDRPTLVWKEGEGFRPIKQRHLHIGHVVKIFQNDPI